MSDDDRYNYLCPFDPWHPPRKPWFLPEGGERHREPYTEIALAANKEGVALEAPALPNEGTASGLPIGDRFQMDLLRLGPADATKGFTIHVAVERIWAKQRIPFLSFDFTRGAPANPNQPNENLSLFVAAGWVAHGWRVTLTPTVAMHVQPVAWVDWEGHGSFAVFLGPGLAAANVVAPVLVSK